MRPSLLQRSLLSATLIALALGLASCSSAGRPTAVAPSTASTVAVSITPTATSLTMSISSAPPTTPPPAATQWGLGSIGAAGVNDPSCTSDQRPVVLLHGTFSTVRSNFAAMTPILQATGRCVFGVDYGSGGTQPVRQSAATVSAFIDDVLALTGAEQVDVVAYSQGGLVLRTALRQDDLSGKVAVAVLIAPSFHGSASTLLNALPAGACQACADQIAGSTLLAELDAGGDLDGDVKYAVASSLNDTVVTPVSSQIPAGPADRVRSVGVQDQCPGEIVDHIALPADPGVIAWTVDALNSAGAPDPAALSCR